jgi:hypothetical protein
MFEHLFGSKTRVKLMKLFLDNPEQRYYVRELTRLTDSLINSVRRELDNLMQLELILCEEEKSDPENSTVQGVNAKKFYFLNQRNVFQKDLLNLFSKGKYITENQLSEKLSALPNVQFISMGGFFVEDDKSNVDVMIVIEEASKGAAKSLLNQFEKEIGRPIRYTVMDGVEYNLREEINDKFLRDVMTNPKNLVVIDNLRKQNSENK